MNLLAIFAFLSLLIALGVFFLFAFIVIFHIKKYGMDKATNARTLLIFCTGLIAISFMMAGKFAAINWDAADRNNPWRSPSINFFHIDYGRN